MLHVALCALHFALPALLLAQTLRRETIHPDADLAPAISPDGQWLAFASNRNGNYDIYVKDLRTGRQTQITRETADDLSPSWSPDGRRIACVSRQEDPEGDIVVADLDLREGRVAALRTTRVTTEAGREDFPSFLSDGQRIAFSAVRGGQENVYLRDLRTGAEQAVTADGGAQPDASPSGDRILFTQIGSDGPGTAGIFCADLGRPAGQQIFRVTSGALDGFPRWGPDGKGLVFCRVTRDANRNGVLDVEDGWGLWVAPDVEDTHPLPHPVQVTPGVRTDLLPRWARDGRLFFASDRGRNFDIWSVPVEGILVRERDAEAQFRRAKERETEKRRNGETGKESLSDSPLSVSPVQRGMGGGEEAVLDYQRCLDFFPDEGRWAAQALLRQATLLQRLGWPEEGAARLRRVLKDYPGEQEAGALAELRLITQAGGAADSALVQLRDLLRRCASLPGPASQTLLQIGEVEARAGRPARALEAYRRALSDYAGEREACAEALIRVGNVLGQANDREGVASAFVSVVRGYADLPAQVERAIEGLMAVSTSGLAGPDRRAAYRRTIEGWPDLPAIGAAAQRALGLEVAAGQGPKAGIDEVEGAVERLRGRRDEVSRTILARARLDLARLYVATGEDDRAFEVYEVVAEDAAGLQGDLAGEARRATVRALLERGERLLKRNDRELALTRFRRILRVDSTNVEALRNIVGILAASGGLDGFIAEYEQRVALRPDDAAGRYALGLAYSYRGERDIGTMRRSIALIEEAVALDPALLHGYLTLSFNYKAMEQMTALQRTSEEVEARRGVKGVAAPFLRAWRAFSRRKEVPEPWLERAVDALNVALVLNDEQERPGLKALLLRNLADLHYGFGEFGFEKAFKYYTEMMRLNPAFGPPKEQAAVFEQIGHAGYVVGRYEEGLDYLRRAADLYAQMGDAERELRAVMRLGLLCQVRGGGENVDQAVGYFRRAEAICGREGWEEPLQRIVRDIGMGYHLLEEPEASEAALSRSRALLGADTARAEAPREPAFIEVGVLGVTVPVWDVGSILDAQGSKASGFGAEDEEALLLTLSAENRALKKDFDGAIALYRQKLTLFEEQRNWLGLAVTQNVIGHLHLRAHRWEEARDFFRESLQRCRRSGYRTGALLNRLALGWIATVQGFQGELEEGPWREAVKVLSEGIAESAGVRTDRQIALWATLGNLYLCRARGATDVITRFDAAERAFHCYQKGLKRTEGLALSRSRVVLQKNIGDAMRHMGMGREALERHRQARDEARRGGFLDLLWRVDLAMGDLMQRSTPDPRSPTPALSLYEEAISILEGLPPRTRDAEVLLSDREDRRGVYEGLIECLIERGDDRRALEVCERMRAREGVDLFGEREVLLEGAEERDKEFWGNVRYLQRKLYEIDRDLARLRGKAEPDTAKVAQMEARRRALEEEYRTRWVGPMAARNPELASFAAVLPLKGEEVRQALREDQTAVEYLVGKEALIAWVVRPDGITRLSLPVWRDSLTALVSEFVDRISTPPERRGAGADVERLSRALYGMLIRPLEPAVEGASQLIVVPDGPLTNLPFGALSDGSSPLFETCSVAKTPSLQVYLFSLRRQKVNLSRTVFATDAPRTQVWEEVAREVLGSEVVQTDSQGVAGALNRGDLVVVDRPFALDPESPLRSGWVRASEDSVRADLPALLNLNLRPALLMLRSEERQKWRNGEPVKRRETSSPVHRFPDSPIRSEVWGGALTATCRALLYAGTPSAVWQRWTPPDEAMQAFHRRFVAALREMSPVDAAAAATAAVRKRFPDPYFWAGAEFIGWPGLSPEEARAFAKANLRKVVLLGNRLLEEKEWRSAFRQYEAALGLATAQGDSTAEQRLCALLAEAARRGGMTDRAAEYQGRALEVAAQSGDAAQEAAAAAALSAICLEAGRYEQAAHHRERVRDIAGRAGRKDAEAEAEKALAVIHERAGDYERALGHAGRAAVLRQGGPPEAEVEALTLMGKIQIERDDCVAALEAFERARALSPPPSEGLSAEAQQGLFPLYQFIGVARERLADYAGAEAAQRTALRLAKGAGVEAYVGQAHQNLANVAWATGDFEKALREQEAALKIAKQTEDREAEMLGLATRGLIEVGLGDLDRGLLTEKRALEVAFAADSRSNQAAILKNVGLMLVRKGDHEAGLNHFRRALATDEALGSKRGQASAHRHIGNALAYLNRPSEARASFERAIALSRDLRDRRNEAQSLYGLGAALQAASDRKEAAVRLAEAEALAMQLRIPDLTWRAALRVGEVQESEGHLEEALQAYDRAVGVVEGMRGKIQTEALRSGFVGDRQEAYDRAILLLLRMGRPEEALTRAERARSQTLVEMLQGRAVRFAGVDSGLVDQERALRQEVEAAQAQLSALRSAGTARPEAAAALEDRLKDLEGQRRAALESVRTANPEVASLLTAEAWSAQDLRERLLPEEALVAYYTTTTGLVAWVVTRDGVTARQAPLSPEEVAEQVSALRAAIRNLLSAQRSARWLYDRLIAPLEADLTGKTHLILVPYGPLHLLPFNALQDAQGGYVIDRWTCSFAPSARVLSICLGKDAGRTAAGVLAFGNPDLRDSAFDLPFAEKEVRSLSRTYRDVRSFLGRAATLETVRREAGGAGLLLFSCHGEYDAAQPLSSALRLSPSAGDDGRLTVADVFGMQFSARLVVLSACETGLGRVTGGDEVVGLTRAFVYAGAPSLVSSLWKVDDVATAVTVKRLFRNLTQGAGRAEALRRAQLDVKRLVNAHPAYWASMALAGAWR